jgi:aminoglycoside phosphotransferase (APT) family kinase protein
VSVAPTLLRRPAPHLLDRVCEAISPGSHPERVRRLPGGIAGGTHAFDLVEPSGERQALVLRRYGDWAVSFDPGVPERAWCTLQALEAAGMLAPRPVWFDGAGTVFGTPAYVMTRVSGRGNICPRDEREWVRQLAKALAALHRTNTETMDLSFLLSFEQRLDRRLSDTSFERNRSHPDAEAVYMRLRELRPRFLTEPPVFSHGDYWPGNSLFHRGRLTAVIDWDDAMLAPRGLDVAYCRLDLTLMTGSDAPDLFLRDYEQEAGVRVEQLALWELFNTLGAMPDPVDWVTGYHDFGRTGVTVEQARERLRAFIAAALARLAD